MANVSFICTQENLVRGLAQVAPAAGRNTQLPILQHVLVQVKDGVLSLTSTDLEVGISSVVGGKATGDGSLAIPARNLFAYVQQLPGINPITVKESKGGVRVQTKGYSAQFSVVGSDDFPLMPNKTNKDSIVVNGKEIGLALQAVIFAAAKDEARPEIKGVYVKIGENGLKMAATDGFRLAEIQQNNMTSKSETILVLPLNAAQEIIRLFGGFDGDVAISPHENHIIINSDEVEFSSRLIDGVYPDYQQIIPKKSSVVVTTSRDELLRALKTLAVFLPRDSRRVEVVVEPENGKIVAQVVGGGSGEGVVEIEAAGSGANTTVIVNIQYLIEGIQHIPTDICSIGVESESSPVVVRPHEAEGYVYVVMPIRS